MLLAVLFLDHGDPVVDAGLADVLVVGVHAVLHGLELVLNQLVEQLLVEGGVLVLELGLADLGDHLVDEIQHGLQVLVGLDDALVHHVVGDLVGLGLDHDDLFVGGCDGGDHAVVLTLGLGGVEEVLLPVPAEDDAGDGAVEGHVGDGDGGGGADHGGDLGAAVAVDGQHFAGDDHVVAQVGGDEGAHGAVDQAGGQHGGQTGLALTAHEAAGDAADGVELLVEVHGEGEVVDAVLGTGGGGAGDEDGGLAVLDENGGVAELCQLADLHGQGAALVHHLKLAVVGELLVGNDHGDSPYLFCTSLPSVLGKTSAVRALFQIRKAGLCWHTMLGLPFGALRPLRVELSAELTERVCVDEQPSPPQRARWGTSPIGRGKAEG